MGGTWNRKRNVKCRCGDLLVDEWRQHLVDSRSLLFVSIDPFRRCIPGYHHDFCATSLRHDYLQVPSLLGCAIWAIRLRSCHHLRLCHQHHLCQRRNFLRHRACSTLVKQSWSGIPKFLCHSIPIAFSLAHSISVSCPRSNTHPQQYTISIPVTCTR